MYRVTDGTCELVVPYPPSVNQYWRVRIANDKPLVYVTKAGMKYKQSVQAIVGLQPQTLSGPVAVTGTIWTPDSRMRDIDNILKATFDALTEAGVWKDDRYVRAIDFRFMGVQKPGRISLKIESIDEQQSLFADST